MRNHVRNADIIHSSIQPNRTAKSDDALSTVLVYGENTTKKPLTSQENLLKTQEKAQKNTQEPLSPLEQDNAEKLAKLESEKLDSGNKIFDFYSDRNFIDFKGVSRLPEITFNASKNTDTDIIHSFIPQARTLKE
ncbi:hypothetical protein VN1239_12760 [Helicobacter pylori]|nr:hypothetical protein VN1239_12760 [Helicobacter pylori]